MSASEAVKKILNSMKVSKKTATEFERKLEEEVIDKWYESCEVMKTTKIPIENIDGFLDYMRRSYEGIDDTKRNELGNITADQSWKEKLVEWRFNKPGSTNIRYGIIVFGRSPDKKYVDCIYVLFKIDFKIASKERLTGAKGASLRSTTQPNIFPTLDNMSGSNNSNEFQNFVRVKALEECCKEGLIEKINYVDCLDGGRNPSRCSTVQAPLKVPNSSKHSAENVPDKFSDSFDSSSDQAMRDKTKLSESSSPQPTENVRDSKHYLPKKTGYCTLI